MQGDFYSQDALVERLTEGARRAQRPVVFLVGSAVTAPEEPGAPGVPNVSGIIELIKGEFETSRKLELEAAISAAENPYQEAFSFLQARRGQNIVNDIVKQAVWKSRLRISTDISTYTPTSKTDDETCRAFDDDNLSWELTSSVHNLGRLVAHQPQIFGQYVLTTNFDPLIEVAIERHGGSQYRTILHRDGNLGQTEAKGCHVVHLHGYWYGADTLHTHRQLTQQRPRLAASLSHILRSRTLVVLGYGGWSDVFTKTLLDLIEDDQEKPEVIWTFHGPGLLAKSELIERLSPGIDRGIVTIYDNVDCKTLLTQIDKIWNANIQPKIEKLELRADVYPVSQDTNVESVKNNIYRPNDKLIFNVRDQDRPPLVDFYVGRSEEARQLDECEENIIFITGIGGQGKSALAANYISRHRKSGRYEYIIWRDCKEEADRFESQIASIVYDLLGSQVSMSELSQLQFDDLVDLFISSSNGLNILIVFDNVDHYIDLESGRILGAAGRFSAAISQLSCKIKAIFTCRPAVKIDSYGATQLRLGGLDLAATRELFQLRGVSAPDEEIERAFGLTGGHAFWLDLIAAQIGRNPDGPPLDELLTTVASGETGLPVATLRSIWDSLKDREQIVLRGLAEAVRPVSAGRLADFLSKHIKYNQLARAVKYLRGLNLIVVKIQDSDTEVLELHPLVRAFVRRTFQPAEQITFVESFLSAYLSFFGLFKIELSTAKPRLETIDRLLEAAEVCVQSGRYHQAFEWLNDARRHYQGAGLTLEYVRVSDALMRAVDWSTETIPPHFDDVFSALFYATATMGRTAQSLSLMDIYKGTVPYKDARHINLCNFFCYYYWISGDYFTAIRWGTEGVDLKKSSGVDTNWDASHNLALAQRDSGAVDAALQHFLLGSKLEKVLENAPAAKPLSGAFYGNIGRCLHLMGQIDNTLKCYKKSAQLIEEETTESSLANKGYIRQWVGEVMYLKGEYKLASACFSSALACWELIAPPKANLIQSWLNGGGGYLGLEHVRREAADKIFVSWVQRDA